MAMGRVPIKSTEKLAMAERTGELKAEAKFRNSSLGAERSLQEHLGKLFDHMAEKIDPLELAAIGATTYFVHSIIMTTQDLLNGFTNAIINPIIQKQAGGSVSWTNIITGGPAEWINAAEGSLFKGLIDMIKGIQPPTTPPPPEPGTQQVTQDHPILWIISFLAAYVIIRFGPAIIQSLGGMTGLIKLVGGLAIA